ncbi:Hypothetical protein FKW44_018432 [Caligus rogercresseyi]|uniref:Uncharacterized protein n=1 Tax=Caligus rogercresseyi TaxID=217165 RepID=A0A7T8GUE1_CALRO|nr:Hypothetical protein FKW44_018432 [Caligus rogercresseyi]
MKLSIKITQSNLGYHIGDLLERAGLPSLNEVAARRWPWRLGNVFTPATGRRCQEPNW